MTETATAPTIPESLISARLMMLQSKRLILATLERRMNNRPAESMRARVDHMRNETATAQARYRASMLEWGTARTPEYWPVAYGCLAEMADRLSHKLRRVADDLPTEQRYEAATDVERLETLVEQWRNSIRSSISALA